MRNVLDEIMGNSFLLERKSKAQSCECPQCIGKPKERKGIKRKSINPFSRTQSNHFVDQEIAPAAVAAGAAVATLGYDIIKDLFNSGSSGDVKWNLKQMKGTKFPNNDKAKYKNIAGYSEQSFSLKGSFEAGYIDEISASFQVTFSYNGHSVSNIYVENTGLNDAVGWGLVVNQDIKTVDQVFYNGSKPVSAVDVKFHFHFSSPLVDKILLITYRLYGNGYYNRTRYTWS